MFLNKRRENRRKEYRMKREILIRYKNLFEIATLSLRYTSLLQSRLGILNEINKENGNVYTFRNYYFISFRKLKRRIESVESQIRFLLEGSHSIDFCTLNYSGIGINDQAVQANKSFDEFRVIINELLSEKAYIDKQKNEAFLNHYADIIMEVAINSLYKINELKKEGVKVWD